MPLATANCCHAASALYNPAPHASPQVRGAYVDKVGGKMLDLFRTYWAAMERLEVGGCALAVGGRRGAVVAQQQSRPLCCGVWAGLLRCTLASSCELVIPRR